MYGDTKKYKIVRKLKDLPEGKHWIILVESSVTTAPFDSKDSPGREDYISIYAFEKEQDWREELTKRSEEVARSGGYSFDRIFPVGLIAIPVRPKIEIKVGVDLGA